MSSICCPICGEEEVLYKCDGNGEAGTQRRDPDTYRWESTCNTIACRECINYCTESDHATCDDCRDKEQSYYAGEYQSGRLGKSIGKSENGQYEKFAEEDPMAFYILSKDNPDRLEEMIDEGI